MKKIGLYMYWQADWATISRLIAEICIAFLAWIEMNWKRNILLFLRGKFPGHQLVGVPGNLPISLNRETKQEETFVGEKNSRDTSWWVSRDTRFFVLTQPGLFAPVPVWGKDLTRTFSTITSLISRSSVYCCMSTCSIIEILGWTGAAELESSGYLESGKTEKSYLNINKYLQFWLNTYTFSFTRKTSTWHMAR
jgi:hypothetical protein